MKEALKPFTRGMINSHTKRDVTLLWPYYPMKCLEAHFDRVLLFDFSVTDGVDHVSAEVNNILKCSKHNSITLNLDKTMEMVVKRWKTSARLFLLQSAAEACWRPKSLHFSWRAFVCGVNHTIYFRVTINVSIPRVAVYFSDGYYLWTKKPQVMAFN